MQNGSAAALVHDAQLPVREDLERDMAGLLLVSRGELLEQSGLTPADFHIERYRELFQVMQAMKAENVPFEVKPLLSRLRRGIWPPAIHADLADLIDCAPAQSGWQWYRDELRVVTKKRNLVVGQLRAHGAAQAGHADEAARIMSETADQFQNGMHLDGDTGFELQPIELCQDPELKPLWSGRIYLSEVNILAATGGMGKSHICLDLAARVSTGRAMPFEEIDNPRPPGNVVLVAPEDHKDVITARLKLLGAELGNVLMLRAGEQPLPRLPSGADDLMPHLERIRPALIIIDSVSELKDPALSLDSEADVREFLAPIKRLALTTGAAVLICRHLNKNEKAGSSNRISGSHAWRDAVRSLLVIGTEKDHGCRTLSADKSSLAGNVPAARFEIYQAGPLSHETAVRWLDQADLGSEDLKLSPPKRQQRQSSLNQDAEATVLAELSDEPVTAGFIRNQTGMRQDRILAALERLEENGQAQRDGKKWCRTINGSDWEG